MNPMNDRHNTRGAEETADNGLQPREPLTPYLEALASILTRVLDETTDLDLLVRHVTRLTGSAVQATRLSAQRGDKKSTDTLANLESLLAEAERLNPGSITGKHTGLS
jgi:hypothetical protein